MYLAIEIHVVQDNAVRLKKNKKTVSSIYLRSLHESLVTMFLKPLLTAIVKYHGLSAMFCIVQDSEILWALPCFV